MFCTFQCITIYTFQRVAPTTPPDTTLVSSFSQHLRFELNTLNLTLGGISVLHKTKYPIASGGLCPPDPLLQRSTTVISPPLSEILDPPLIIPAVVIIHITRKTEVLHTKYCLFLVNLLISDILATIRFLFEIFIMVLYSEYVSDIAYVVVSIPFVRRCGFSLLL